MAKLNIAPTKSSLLWLRRQLAFAEEGFDLLEQKRQLLSFELMSRLKPLQALEQNAVAVLAEAFSALRGSLLEIGSEAFDRALPAVRLNHEVELSCQHLVGVTFPRASVKAQSPGVQFGIGGTSASMDLAMRRFVEVLSLLVQLAEQETAILRLARELRKTQRRCNALSKILIPGYRETMAYIVSSLEERERESFVILRMIRDRLNKPVQPAGKER